MRKGVCYGSGEDVRYLDRGGNHEGAAVALPQSVTWRFAFRVWSRLTLALIVVLVVIAVTVAASSWIRTGNQCILRGPGASACPPPDACIQ